MTTEGNEVEVIEPRDITTLMSLDTYQGMTDDEIELVIQYRCERAAELVNTAAINEKFDQLRSEIAHRDEVARANSSDLFARMLARSASMSFREVPNE